MDSRRPTRIRWLLLAWIFVMSAVTYLDRVNIAISGSRLAHEYGLSDVALGSIFSAFVIGYALFQIPGGWLADRFGARRVLTAGALWWGVFTALTASVPARLGAALMSFWAVRFMLGAGEAVVYPSSNRFVANWIPTGDRGIANGVIFAGVGAGAGLTPLLITAIMTRFGWRASFWVCALVGCVAGVVWFWLARDTPESHPRVNADELELISAGRMVSAAAAETRNEKTRVPWRAVLGSREILASTFSYFCYGYTAYIFFTWFFIYLVKERGIDVKRSAWYTMFPPIAMMIGSALGGLAADAISRRRGKRAGRSGTAVAGMALAAVLVALGSGAKSAALASVVFAGGVGALYLSQSSFWALTADIAGPSAGTVSGLMNMGGQFGGATTALVTPLIARHFGWEQSFLAASALCVLGALAWLFVDPNRVLPRESG